MTPTKGTTSKSTARKRNLHGKLVKIDTWTGLHGELEHMRDSGWIFRGVTSPDHHLVPGIGREKVFRAYDPLRESRLFDEFKLRAVSLVPDGRFDDWGWLAFAQHIGVPTRLLDWSVNPLVALYFALESDTPSDRVVYAVSYSRYVHEVARTDLSPLKNKTEGRFTAPLAFDRIRAQRGVFTIHPHPTEVFSPPGLKRLVIPEAKVKHLRRRLFKYGIDHWHIYPDMEGLGKQLAWQVKNGVGLGSVPSSS
jgi:hypothetical protein